MVFLKNKNRNRSFILFGLNEQEFSNEGIRLLFIFYIGAIFLSALISPFVYHGVLIIYSFFPPIDSDLAGFQGWFAKVFSYLSGKSYADYFDRIRWLPIILFFPWLLTKCKLLSYDSLFHNLKNPLKRNRLKCLFQYFQILSLEVFRMLLVLGLDLRNKKSKFIFFKGWVIGVLLVGILFIGQITSFSIIERNEITFIRIIEVISLSFISGALIGFLEEIVFRGLVFRIFYTMFSPFYAIFLAAIFFSYCHFKFPDFLWDESQPVSIVSGFYVGLWTLLGIFKNFEWILFLNLGLLSLLLNYFVLKENSIIRSIGLHAGLVFGMLFFKRLWILQDHGQSWFWGSGKITDGLACGILLVVLNLYFYCFVAYKKQNEVRI